VLRDSPTGAHRLRPLPLTHQGDPDLPARPTRKPLDKALRQVVRATVLTAAANEALRAAREQLAEVRSGGGDDFTLTRVLADHALEYANSASGSAGQMVAEFGMRTSRMSDVAVEYEKAIHQLPVWSRPQDRPLTDD
jgi:hypothetical protein